MNVQAPTRAHGRAPLPRRRFEPLLEEAAPVRTRPHRPGPVLLLPLSPHALPTGKAPAAPAAQRQDARHAMDAQVRRRVERADEALAATEDRHAARARELLAEALGTTPQPLVPPGGGAVAVTCSAGPVEGASRSGGTPGLAALELVERVETFLRSSRPALALTLRAGFPGRVELERMGPGAVAIRLVGRTPGARRPDVQGLRQALNARGVRLLRLELA